MTGSKIDWQSRRDGFDHGRDKPTSTPINWKYWGHLSDIAQWEACALSLNINPHDMKRHPQGWMAGPGSPPIFTTESFSSVAAKAEFDKRLLMLNGIAKGNQLASVNPGQFAALCTFLEFDGVPPELLTMAATLPSTAPESAPAPNTATPAPMEKVVFSAPPSLISISASGLRMFDGDGYKQYLSDKAERNAKGRYTMAEAAQVMADAHSLNPDNFLEHRMMPAFDSDRLRVIDPTDGGPVHGRKCNAYSDEVTPAGIDEWLSAEGFEKHVRWPEPAAINTATDATKPPEQAQSEPLSTSAIAQLFDGLPFATDRWASNLSAAKWLKPAKRGLGEQGGASATWCPLTIAQLVYDHEKGARAKQKALASLNSRFRTNPVLKPWKDAWDDYYGMFTEPGEA